MKPLYEKQLKILETIANVLRQDVVRMLAAAGSGHSAGSLGMADIVTALYFHILNHNPKQPLWPDRDRLILSNGHICPVVYAALAEAGYFKKAELADYRKINSRLQGHPHRKSLPGIETTSGALGSGLSQAIGVALAAQLDQKKFRVYCLLSDGEHNEGNLWEAIMFAGKRKINNITAIIDRNNIQIDGYTEDVMPLEPLRSKYDSFNWHVIEVDGHSFEQIISAVAEAKAIYEKPTVIIAHTIAGRGVSFMENNFRWHGIAPGTTEGYGSPPRHKQEKEALIDLRTLRA